MDQQESIAGWAGPAALEGEVELEQPLFRQKSVRRVALVRSRLDHAFLNMDSADDVCGEFRVGAWLVIARRQSAVICLANPSVTPNEKSEDQC
jgi:hypothetical protein